MQIRPEDVAADGALTAIRTVVAETGNDFRERPGAGAEVCPATVVLEADERGAVPSDDDIADETLRSRAGVHGVQIEDADTGELIAVSATVEVPGELVNTAYRQHDEAALGGVFERRPLHVPQVVCDAALLAVLSPADESHVVCGWVERH